MNPYERKTGGATTAHLNSGQMSGQDVRNSGAIRCNLTVPVTRIGIGIFSVDPLAQLLGQPLSYVLQPLLVAPIYQRPSRAGAAVDVYPLALPPGEGASIRLGQFGDIGFANDQGLLKLIVPWSMLGWVQQRLTWCMAYGPREGTSVDGSARIAEVWIRLQPGMAASLPLGMFGELGLEAG